MKSTKVLPAITSNKTNNEIYGFGSVYIEGSSSKYAPLNKRVLFQNFSFVIPMFEDESEDGLYKQILPHMKELRDVGITDIWWPPPYKALSLNEYKEGYAVADRYDVGEFDQQGSTRTKYGFREDLEYALSYAHECNIRNMADLVPNQMYLGDLTVGPCVWTSDSVNMTSSLAYYNNFPVTKDQVVTAPRPVCGLNAAYSRGGGLGQQTYGTFPKWEYYYYNGFFPSGGILSTGTGTGMNIVMRDANYIPYRFFGGGDSRNYLPDWLQDAYNKNPYISIQNTDTYLLITQGWVDFVHFIPYACYYQEEYNINAVGTYYFNPSGKTNSYSSTNVFSGTGTLASTTGFGADMRNSTNTDPNVFQKQRFLDYLKELPIDPSINENTSDDDLINWIKNYVGSDVGYQMSVWVAAQPGYGGQNVNNNGYNRSIVMWNTNPSDDDVVVMQNYMFDIKTKQSATYSTDIEGEFLLGTDVNNENTDVLYDTLNWQKFLLNLGYDGFRFDAAGWYSNRVLTQSAILMSNLYGDDLKNHLSVLEDYGNSQSTYAYGWSSYEEDGDFGYNGMVNCPQLTYDTGSYYCFQVTFFRGFEGGNILGYFQSSQGGSKGAFSYSSPEDIDTTLLPLNGYHLGGQFRGGSDCVSYLNWSFVTNHDNELNDRINQYPTNDGTDGSTLEGARNRCSQYCYDRRIRNKLKAPKNIVMCYGLVLFNDFTVPTVCYGDLYDPHEPYMSVKSPYYAAIMLLLKVRQRYCVGQQFNQFYTAGDTTTAFSTQQYPPMVDIAALMRFGTSRDTGCVFVVSTNENLSVTITVPFSRLHPYQTMKNVLAIGEEYAQTDAHGNFDVFVTPVNTPITQGYMSLWVPI